MQYIIYVYLLIFFISIVVNSILWIRAKANIYLLVYEVIATSYLIAATLIYFTPDWIENVNIWFCLPIIPVMITDVYMTVWGKDEWICPPGFKHSEIELELSRIVAVIFASPVYISGIMLLIQSL